MKVYDEVYDRIVAPNLSRPHAAILKARAAQNCHLYLAFDAHTVEKIYENTSNLNSTACPTFDWAHLDGLALGPVFRVLPAEGRHEMTNKPPPWGCAPPQLPRLLRMIRPDRRRVRGLLCNATVGRRRGLLEPDRIVTEGE